MNNKIYRVIFFHLTAIHLVKQNIMYVIRIRIKYDNVFENCKQIKTGNYRFIKKYNFTI